MRSALHGIHFLFAAVWLGCVLTEALFERALLPEGAASRKILARLHVRVDKLIELPAIAGVLATGVALLAHRPALNVGSQVMVSAGAIAVVANAYCVWLVFQRNAAAEAEDWSRFEALDHKQHKYGALVLVGILVAIVAGIMSRSAA